MYNENKIEFIPRTCQWIFNKTDMCGSPVLKGTSYCYKHYSKAYQTTKEEKDLEETFKQVIEKGDSLGIQDDYLGIHEED